MDRRKLADATKDKFGSRQCLRIVRAANGFVVSSILSNDGEDIYVFETLDAMMNAIDILAEQIVEPYSAKVISGKYRKMRGSDPHDHS